MNRIESDVVAAARGYYDAFKAASADLVRRHFLPTAAKIGAMYDYEKSQFQDDLMHHDFQQIIEFASQYNAVGRMPATEPRLQVLDVQDRTAVVKLTAEWANDHWGTDYVLLAKSGERWMIAGILWQSTV